MDRLFDAMSKLFVGQKVDVKNEDYLLALGESLGLLASLASRVRTLERRPEMKHVGIWRKGLRYEERNYVSHAGSLWMCCAPTSSATPGKSPAWRLVVKRGDAR